MQNAAAAFRRASDIEFFPFENVAHTVTPEMWQLVQERLLRFVSVFGALKPVYWSVLERTSKRWSTALLNRHLKVPQPSCIERHDSNISYHPPAYPFVRGACLGSP